MDGVAPNDLYLQERRRRLAAERMLDSTRSELTRAHAALVANADRLSRRYLSERETNLGLSERQEKVLAQRKEAAERADRARRRLWHALEAMRDGFALFDADGRMIAANSVYLQLFEADASIGPGTDALDLFTLAAEEGAFDIGELEPEDWAQAHLARWDTDPIAPLVVEQFDGRTLRLTDRRAPDGDVVSLAIDITDETAQAAALGEARDEAQAMARVKADFLARMSHEIRTPMNGVIGLADLLIEKEGDAEDVLYARTIRDSAEALLTIVNDTLDVSRIEAGAIDLREERFDLEGLLGDCLRLGGVAARAGVEIGLAYPLDAPTMVQGDPGRLRQIVMNLLGNAIRFTMAGHVAIRVTAARKDGAWGFDIAVEDTGPGIPEAEQSVVFEAFGQAQSADSARAAEGTGLGLTISRGLAERMGGRLSLDSRVGRGSVFTLHVPLVAQDRAPLPGLAAAVHVPPTDLTLRLIGERLAGVGIRLSDRPGAFPSILRPDGPPEGQPRLVVGGAGADLPTDPTGAVLIAALMAAPTPPEPAPDATPSDALPRVLVADDNATNRLLLDRMMRGTPYAFEIVDDGRQAVDAYARQRPDAVVLDISMPVMDGFEAAAAIQAADADPTPLIALTAHVGDDVAQCLRDAGFRAVLGKPLRKQELLDELAAAISEARPASDP